MGEAFVVRLHQSATTTVFFCWFFVVANGVKRIFWGYATRNEVWKMGTSNFQTDDFQKKRFPKKGHLET